MLMSEMYDTDWSAKHEERINDLIKNTNSDFIYFNYLERDGVVNQELVDIIKVKNLKVIEVNNKTIAGQGRNKNITNVKEVIITNIKN